MDAIPEGAIPVDQFQIANNESAPAGAIPIDQFQPAEAKHGSLGQQILTGVEGVAQGFAGPLATQAELGLSRLGVPGLSAEDITARKEENPTIHGAAEATGLMAGLYTGVGELGLISKALKGAEFLGEASKAAKIGSAAIKGAIEMGLIQSGNEVSDAMLGKIDPENAVAPALAHVGGAMLLGGVFGGSFDAAGQGLKALADTKTGAKAAQFLQDFGNRWRFNQENPNIADAIAEELGDFHVSTKAAADEVYGATGLKSQAIQKLVPEMNDAISLQNNDIANRLTSKITEMVGDPESYPSRLTKKLQSDANQWLEIATNPNARSADVFNATQELKQKLQAYSKFEKMVTPLSPEKDFIGVAKELSHDIRVKLEDSRVWGKAGDIQRETNKAFTDFLPSLKDFEKRFTQKLQGEAVLNPDTIKTYVNQISKEKGAIRQEALDNFVTDAEKYRSKIDNLYHQLGLESPIQPVSMNATRGTLKEALSPGARAADDLYHISLPRFASHATQSGAGAVIGYHEGGVKGAIAGGALGMVGPHIENAVLQRLTRSAVPAALSILSSGRVAGIGQSLDYAAKADSGAQKIIKGLDYLFKTGSPRPDFGYSAVANREKLKKYIEDGKLNAEIQQQLNDESGGSAGPQPSPSPTPRFAHGGMVNPQFEPKPHAPQPPVLEGTSGLANHFPAQNMMIQAARGRISNYLNAQRPQPPTSKLPYDTEIKSKSKERDYDKVIDMANDPLSIIHHIKDGTLTPKQVGHFKALYPEIYNHLSKKMTERIVKSQMDGDKPSRKVRQSLGMFLGAPLETSMSPMSVAAAQRAFAPKQGPQAGAPATPTKKGSTAIGKAANSMRTPMQAIETRQQRDH